MKALETLDGWPVWRKLLVIAASVAGAIAGVLLSVPDAFPFFLILGLIVCVVAGFWLGPRAWFLVPLVAIGIEILIGVPTTVLYPDGETPISVVLEAPFWAGIPSLVGALIGAGLRALIDRRGHSTAHRAA